MKKSFAVIGLGFGDEGKGRVTDWLCSKENPSLVVRFSGGQQAGHQVIHSPEKSHVFSNFGSGTFHNIPTYFSKFCTVDPIGILNEYRILKNMNIDPILYIDAKCPVTTPYDKDTNLKDDSENKHGTCGVGVGATWQREEDHYHLLFGDLFHPEILKIKLKLIAKYRRWYYPDVLSTSFLSDCNKLTKLNVVPTNGILNTGDYLFEGSQGILLDQDIGFFPHVTRSNTGTKNIHKIFNNNFEIYYVTRAYQTRHGNGPMTNESIPHNIKSNPHEKNFDNGNQGIFRKTLLDLDLLLYALNNDSTHKNNEYCKKTLVITCLDLIQDEYRLTIHGEIENHSNQNEFIQTIKNYLKIDNILLSNLGYGDLTKFEGK